MASTRRHQDDDLALFQDMRARERNKYLYLVNDDPGASPTSKYIDGLLSLDASASTLPQKNSDLLTSDSEKNDYDWLLTPPGTPLFPSLDQDVPIVNLSQRRVLTRSASASRTSRLSYPQESYSKALGGNPSPRRSSAVSSSSSLTSTVSRGRPSSSSLRSSPTLRPSSPCRPTTPTGRVSVTASRSTSRSATPPIRGTNTSPSSASRAGLANRGTRGKSLSPKLRPWEPSMPGFSADPPPNLRTSASDRGYQRGGSQGSRHSSRTKSRGSYSEASDCNQPHWYTISPDASGSSWSLANSHDKNSSRTSRGSVISSCDDDMEVAESVISISTRASSDGGPKAAKISSRPENLSFGKGILPAKRQNRPATGAGDAVPVIMSTRKPFDRQAVQRRSSQNMFRPLLSNAPVTSIYRTTSTHHRPTNPSLATMDGSSDHANSSCESKHKEGGMEVTSHNENGSHTENSRAISMNLDGQAAAIHNDEGLKIKEPEEEMTDNNQVKEHAQADSENSSDGWESKDALPYSCEVDYLLASNKQDVNSLQKRCKCGQGLPLEHLDPACRCTTDKLCNREMSQLEAMNCGADIVMKDIHLQGQGHHDDHHDQEVGMYVPACSSHGNGSVLKSGDFEEEQNKSAATKLHPSSKPKLNVDPQEPNFAVMSSENDRNSHSAGVVSGVSPQNGTQWPSADLTSLRRQSSSKITSMRFQDGIPITEKSLSDLSASALASMMGDNRSLCDGEADSEPAFSTPRATSIGKSRSCLDKDRLIDRQELSHSSVLMEHVSTCQGVVSNSVASSIDLSAISNCDSLPHVVNHEHGQLEKISVDESVLGDFKEPNAVDNDCNLLLKDVVTTMNSSTNEDGSGENAAAKNCQRNDTSSQSRSRRDSVSNIFDILADDAFNNGAEDTDMHDGLSTKQSSSNPLLKRNVTLEEATDTILFCSSIIHEIVYKAASIAMEEEKENTGEGPRSKREFVTLFGFSGADQKLRSGGKGPSVNGGRRRPLASSVIRQTFNQVQKQRMIHQQTMAVTMRHSPMDRIENAVMGNNEEILTPIPRNKQKRMGKQTKKVRCKCRCCIM